MNDYEISNPTKVSFVALKLYKSAMLSFISRTSLLLL